MDLDGVSVLDLFAGTGMVALEFMSRGVETVTSVELDSRAAKGMYTLARDWELEDWQIIRGDAFQFIQNAVTQFDLIFADPPYDLPNLKELPVAVMSSSLLMPNGWFILEHGERIDVSGTDYFVETRKYGHVHFSLFRK